MSEEIKKPEENVAAVPETDISKVKITHILAQRMKKCGAKKIIAVILLAVICFGGGILTDRLALRHGAGRNFYGRPGMQRNMRGNSFGNRNDNKSPQNQQSTQNSEPTQ